MATEADKGEQRHGGVIGWIFAHPKTTAFVVFFLLLALVIVSLHERAESILQARIAAIKARGEPTTIQDLIKLQPVIPDEENLVVQLVRHIRSSPTSQLSEDDSDSLPLLGRVIPAPTGERWRSEHLRAAKKYLASKSALLTQLQGDTRLQRGVLKVAWSTPAINVLIPELSDIRNVSKHLALAAQTAAQEGDRQRAEDDLLTVLPLTKNICGDGPLINALVQMAITALTCDTIERCVNLGGVSEPTLKTLQAGLCHPETAPDMHKAMLSERVMFLDTCVSTRSAGPPSVIRGAAPSAWRFIPALPAIDITEGLYAYTAICDASRQPTGKAIQELKAVEVRRQAVAWYCLMSRAMVPSLSRAVVLWVRHVGSTRALQAAIAAERYRLANGHWPDRLEELAPTYLEAVPIDPIDGRPIRYKVIPEGIKTWTICDDDQNADDGGDVRRLEKRTASQRPKDYGWVILNPELRGRPAASTQPSATSGPVTRPAEHP